MSTAIYTVSGVTLCSEIPLPATLTPGRACDVHVVAGPSTDAAYRRPGLDVVAELTVDGWPRYTFVQTADGYVGRVYGLADFHIDATLTRVVCRPDARADPGLVPILVCGTVVSFLLMARGQMVLHASSVVMDEGALAFSGPPLQGKSTLATIMCSGGAPLLADDVLPLEIEDDVLAIPGTGLLRLREGASRLLDRFPGELARATVLPDQRTGLVPPAVEEKPQPVVAVALPRPTRDAGAVLDVRRLPSGEAVFRLAEAVRIEGWRRPVDLARWFDAAAAVAQRVPVYELRVPWGPPFSDTLARDLAAALGLTLPSPQTP